MTNASDKKGYSDFIREFVTDPASVPDVMSLYGYLGQSTEDGHERLYQTPNLTPYIEIPANAILHRRKAAHDPLGGCTVWVRRDAKLIYKMTPTAQAQASYFAGALQANAAARAPVVPGQMFAPLLRHHTLPGYCPVTIQLCGGTAADCPPHDMDPPPPRHHHTAMPFCQGTAADCGPNVFFERHVTRDPYSPCQGTAVDCVVGGIYVTPVYPCAGAF